MSAKKKTIEPELERLIQTCLRLDFGVHIVATLKSLSSDQRTSVRRRVAEIVGLTDGLDIESGEDLLRRLTGDPAEEVRAAAAEGLGSLLRRAGQMSRTRILGEWATSNDSFQREAIAKALRQHLHVLGDAPAIEHLAGDPEPRVREATADAAAIRSPSRPERYAGVLERLTRDECERVRLAAEAGLAHASRLIPGPAGVSI